MTNMPTENMINTMVLFLHEVVNFQTVGIGIKRIIKSWRMLMPAATYATAITLMHSTGGILYIQFVQLPYNGI